jgi:hypothetical protein
MNQLYGLFQGVGNMGSKADFVFRTSVYVCIDIVLRLKKNIKLARAFNQMLLVHTLITEGPNFVLSDSTVKDNEKKNSNNQNRSDELIQTEVNKAVSEAQVNETKLILNQDQSGLVSKDRLDLSKHQVASKEDRPTVKADKSQMINKSKQKKSYVSIVSHTYEPPYVGEKWALPVISLIIALLFG